MGFFQPFLPETVRFIDMKNIKILILLLLLVGAYFMVNLSKPISQQKVESIVKSLPEVKVLLNNSDSFVKAEKRGDDWVVQVASTETYEKDLNIPSHTATFNWYRLDQRGKIICSMSNYDKQGKYLGSGEIEKPCI